MTRKRLHFALLAAASALSLSTAAHADPAVIYDMGGKFDKSFNQEEGSGQKLPRV
jgi:basic membrane protein A and related proteins